MMTSEMKEVMERALVTLHVLECQNKWASIHFESNTEAGIVWIEALNSIGEPSMWVFCRDN